MRKTVRNITLILFLGILVACGFAVLYLGTSTGLTFGGSGTRLTQQSGSDAMYGQAGWLRNTAPWPITITSITTNASNVTKPPGVYIISTQTAPRAQSSKPPGWSLSASSTPYQLDGGALQYLAFSLTPQPSTVAEMTSITVTYTGPLGLKFHATFSGTRVATAASDLPGGLLGPDPRSNSSSLDAYIVELRNSLLQPDPKTVSQVMGNGATMAQAEALITAEEKYKTADLVQATVQGQDRRTQSIVFYAGDPTKDGLPPIDVVWAHYRWGITPSGQG
ncbi:MAG TPA: hypothetical protein VHX87_00475 [Galbitalea sp.]|jgi:hypothetical protein|nr:hypothetical protein [Galbitalea sp.]